MTEKLTPASDWLEEQETQLRATGFYKQEHFAVEMAKFEQLRRVADMLEALMVDSREMPLTKEEIKAYYG